MEASELTVGEVLVLKLVAPGHPVGDTFDPSAVIESGRKVSVTFGDAGPWRSLFDMLVAKGLLERLGPHAYSLTGRGEDTWKEIAGDNWKHAREGAGIGWKGKRRTQQGEA